MKKLRLVAVLAAFGLPVVSVQAQAQAAATATAEYQRAADIPVEAFFRRSGFSQLDLSPDGSKFVAVIPINGRNNLVMVDLATRKSAVLTRFSDVDVWSWEWLSRDRVYFEVANANDASGELYLRGRFAVDIDGKNSRNLAEPTSRSQYQRGTATVFNILSRTFDNSGDVIVEMNERNRAYPDVYRYNTRTGEYKLLTFDSPGNILYWVIDHDLVPRIAVRQEPRERPNQPLRQTVWHRAGADGAWEKIDTLVEEGDEDSTVKGGARQFRPIAFDFDNKTLFVTTRGRYGKTAIYRYDIGSRKLGEAVAEHPLIDIGGGLLWSRDRRAFLGVRYSAERPAVAWIDAQMAKLQAGLDKALPHTINDIRVADENTRFNIIYSYSDRDPGTYYLFDSEKATLEKIAASREWLPPKLMAERRYLPYRARDGRTIPAWVTLPAGMDAKNLPLIVHIHGGPWVRAYHGTQWGAQPVAQFLASRGYAVLEPEPRGSSGFGGAHLVAGYKQFGLAMQDDITDGALHLVQEGIADRSRMCLFGASYGGYATLQGLVKNPDLWKCGSAYVAVTDLELLQTVQYSDTARYTDFLETDFKRRVGDKDRDREQFLKTSPARNADKIQAAVMLTMGADDQRVPLIHGEKMRDAMHAAGKVIEYKVYDGEAHGFNKPENVIDFFKRNERFFAEHLKPATARAP